MGTINKGQQFDKNAISTLAFLPLGLLLFTVSLPVALKSEALTCKQLGALAANSPDCQDFGNSNKNPQTSTSASNKELVMIESAKGSGRVATLYVDRKTVVRRGNQAGYNTEMIVQSLDGKTMLNLITVNISDCDTNESRSLGIVEGTTGKVVKSGLTPKEELIEGTAAYKALQYACYGIMPVF